jgi:hypothetical protein
MFSEVASTYKVSGMRNILLIIFLFLLISSEAWAQKILEKSWDAAGIQAVEIRSDAVFNITIASEATNTILLTTKVEGETYEQVVLEVSKEKELLTIGTGFTPYFNAKNDKLAAHKVLSIEMELTLPKGLSLYVFSKRASVKATGHYNQLNVSLATGTCLLSNFKGNALLLTKEGDIRVTALNSVRGEASSITGTVVNKLSTYGKYTLIAESINGNITLSQTK